MIVVCSMEHPVYIHLLNVYVHVQIHLNKCTFYRGDVSSIFKLFSQSNTPASQLYDGVILCELVRDTQMGIPLWKKGSRETRCHQYNCTWWAMTVINKRARTLFWVSRWSENCDLTLCRHNINLNFFFMLNLTQ